MFDRIWQSIFQLAALVLLGLFAFLVVTARDGQFATLCAIVLALIGSRMKDLLKFKLSPTGLEGELRTVIDEARATVAQLHALAVTQAKALLQANQSLGRFGGGSLEGIKDRVRGEIVENLGKIGLSQAGIDSVLAVEYPYIQFDYAYEVTRQIQHSVPEDKRPQWNNFFYSSNRSGIGFEPSPDEIEAFLGSVGMIDADTHERILDYRHFVKSRKHRRPEVWAIDRAG